MATKRQIKWLKGIGITAVVLLLLTFALNFYVSRHAARYLEDVVARQSGGKLRLQVKGFTFNYFTDFIEVRNGRLQSLDTISKPATYDIRLEKLSLHLQSFWPLILQRKLLLDSIKVHNPEVAIYRWRKDPALQHERNQVSLPSELGRLYQSMLEGLDALQLKRISIDGGDFTLYNKIKRDEPPVRLADVNFSLYYPEAEWKERPAGARRNVWLHIPKQTINLPDGRHRLAFNQLHLELFRQRLALDSCTISTTDTASAKTKYAIFFKQLLLTGVDFDALYHLNKIKADSVYCFDPTFDVEIVRRRQQVADSAKVRPRPQEVMSEIQTDLELAYVGVRSAGFNILFNGNKKRTLSNAQRDDFALRGLRIKSDSTSPFTVREFDMKVRGYELYNEDSTAAFRFDSVQIRNNRITLRQFSASTFYARDVAKNAIRYQVPLFELEGLDWFALIFEERLQARRAYLYNPDIYFKANKPRVSRPRQPLFDLLNEAASLVSLQRIEVYNGNLHLLPKPGTEIRLSGASLVLDSDTLLKATNQAGIKSSVGGLLFSKGTIKTGSALIELNGMRYSDTGSVLAASFALRTPALQAQLQNVSLNDAVLDQEKNQVIISGLQWSEGALQLRDAPAGGGGAKKSGEGLVIENLSGRNTTVRIAQKALQVQTVLPVLGAAQLGRTGDGNILAEGLYLNGNAVTVKTPKLTANTGSYSMERDGSFALQKIQLQQVSGQDSMLLQAASLNAQADVASLTGGRPHIQRIELNNPELILRKHQRQDSGTKEPRPLPAMRIDEIVVRKPELDFVFYKNEQQQGLKARPDDDAFIKVQNINTANETVSVGRAVFRSGPLQFTAADGRVMGTEKGSVFISASNLTNGGEDGPAWAALLDSMRITSPGDFAWGKKGSRLKVEEVSGGSLMLSKDLLQSGGGLLLKSPKVWLAATTGTYSDSTTTMYWKGARFNAAAKQLSLDTLSVVPVLSRDSFIAASPYQTDYLTFHSGPVTMSGINQQLLERDSAFIASAVRMVRPVITVYRDKRPPFKSGIIKPLPAAMIKALRLPVLVNRVELQHGLVTYTELNDKTAETGTITLNNLNATISNIRSRDIKPTDSLTLQMNASLLDSARLSLRFRQSYTDSLGGFRMNLRMTPTSLSFLNPIVAPLSSINIQSGTVDSLRLQAIGHDLMALGEMHLFYRNLRIRFVNVGEQNRPKILLNTMSFLANLVLRKNNNGRKSLMYLERMRDRSFFNYLIKMTFNGLAAGVGVKKNKKALKQYKKDVEQLQLPYFENEAHLEELVESQRGGR